MTSSGQLCGPEHSFRTVLCCSLYTEMPRDSDSTSFPFATRNENVVVVSPQTLNRYKQTNTTVITTLSMLSVYTTGKG